MWLCTVYFDLFPPMQPLGLSNPVTQWWSLSLSHQTENTFMSSSAHCGLSPALRWFTVSHSLHRCIFHFHLKNQLHKIHPLYFRTPTKEKMKWTYMRKGEKLSNRRNRNPCCVYKILVGSEVVIYFSAIFHKAGVRAASLVLWEKWKLVQKHKKAIILQVFAAVVHCFPYIA